MLIPDTISAAIPTNAQLEIARVALGVGLALSNVAVWYGVRQENELFPREARDRGWKILIRALAVEAGLAFLLLAVDTTVSLRQGWEIAAAQAKNLELEAQLGPRVLTQDEISTLEQSLAPFAGRSVMLMWSPGDLEQFRLARQIALSLRKLKIGITERWVSGDPVLIGAEIAGPESEQNFVAALEQSFASLKLRSHLKPLKPGDSVVIHIGFKPAWGIETWGVAPAP